ncbi:hypothetical protein KKHLCK_06255 [Candidatus Electrothrix laxa]
MADCRQGENLDLIFSDKDALKVLLVYSCIVYIFLNVPFRESLLTYVYYVVELN